MEKTNKPAELLLTYRGVVYPQQCDHMGHMNVMHYVGKFDEATWQMFAAIGITPEYMRVKCCGVAAVRQIISYRRELKAGDLITIRTAILEVHSNLIRFYHEMTDDVTGELTATTVITGVYIDTRQRTRSTFPEEIVQKAEELIVDLVPVI